MFNRIASRLLRNANTLSNPQGQFDFNKGYTHFQTKLPDYNEFMNRSGIKELIQDMKDQEMCFEDGGQTTMEWYQDTIRDVNSTIQYLKAFKSEVQMDFRNWSTYDTAEDPDTIRMNRKEVKPYL